MRFYLLFILLILGLDCLAQSKPSISISQTSGPITIDGDLNEWGDIPANSDFTQNFPTDTLPAKSNTEVRVAYDDKYLYVSAVCHDPIEGDYIVESLKRDFNLNNTDCFAIFLDPFNDGTNGFVFAVSPVGTQFEALVQGGGQRGTKASWDNKWESAVMLSQGKWSLEMAIPFKTLRYKSDVTTWGVNFVRNDFKQNERTTWSRIPRNFGTSSLAYTGRLNWLAPPAKAGRNTSIIPYVIGGGAIDYEGSKKISPSANIGADAKIAITSSLNLDLTINPDFSQVDVDRQQTNLTRFSLFFPERRQFFLENSDLFASYGFSRIRPFFSRRIGLADGEQVPIIAGARLSGKLNKNWRIGFLNVQTAAKAKDNEQGDMQIAPTNFAVATVQRQLNGRSTLSAIFVNKQKTGTGSGDDFNRVIGADYNLATANNRWTGKVFQHQSFSPGETGGANATWLMFSSQNFFAMWNHEYVHKNYDAQVGFVPRNKLYNPTTGNIDSRTYWRIEPFFNFSFFPKSDKVQSHGPGLYYDQFMDENMQTTDVKFRPNYQIKFVNSSIIDLKYEFIFTQLTYDTDVTFSGNDQLPIGAYRYKVARAKYVSDRRKTLKYELGVDYGEYYTGIKASYQAKLGYIIRPWGSFNLTYSRNDIILPTLDENVTLNLIGPQVQLTLTRSLFFSTFIQYNSQIENVNINSRIQWRFKPMSDLFIVYTDNYDPMLRIKNRALVVKLSYWI